MWCRPWVSVSCATRSRGNSPWTLSAYKTCGTISVRWLPGINCRQPLARVAGSSAIQKLKGRVSSSRHSPLSWCHGVALPVWAGLRKQLLNLSSRSSPKKWRAMASRAGLVYTASHRSGAVVPTWASLRNRAARAFGESSIGSIGSASARVPGSGDRMMFLITPLATKYPSRSYCAACAFVGFQSGGVGMERAP